MLQLLRESEIVGSVSSFPLESRFELALGGGVGVEVKMTSRANVIHPCLCVCLLASFGVYGACLPGVNDRRNHCNVLLAKVHILASQRHQIGNKLK